MFGATSINLWSFYETTSRFFKKWKLPAAVTHWLSESKPVRALRLFWESDLSRQNIFNLASKLDKTHYHAAKALYDDYNQFVSQPQTIHRNVKLKKAEKLAFTLTKRKHELSHREQELLRSLLLQLENHDTEKRAQTLILANQWVREIYDNHLCIGDALEKLLNKLKAAYNHVSAVDLDEVVFLVRSKVCILNLDRNTDKKMNIAYLIPVYKELNRLKRKSETFTGENFLSVKCEQLRFLFADCQNIGWDLYFVDDESPTGQCRSIDVIKNKIETEAEFSDVKQAIHCLGYEELQDQIACYNDTKLSALSPEDFSARSIKGGAMHCALRYLSGISSQTNTANAKADVIVMSDADLSTHLGITGNVIWECITNHTAMAIGSRRLPGSVVIGKSSERHLLSFAFNFLAHALLNVQVSDTQVGCKAVLPNAVRKIHKKFSDLTMSFDVEMIRALQDCRLPIMSIPTFWCDSPLESKSADQSENMFVGLLSLWKNLYSNEEKQASNQIVTADEELFSTLTRQIANEPEFIDLMALAKDKKFNFLVNFSSEIYAIITPKTWRNFINHFSLFLCELAAGSLSQTVVNLLFDDIEKRYYVKLNKRQLLSSLCMSSRKFFPSHR